MTWQPQPDSLNTVLQTLRESQSPDNAVQSHVHQKLQAFSKIPDYCNYLAYILTQLQQEEPAVRSVAGLLLKNELRHQFQNLPPEVLEYLKNCVSAHLGDPHTKIRSTIGTIITTIISRDSLKNWPNILPRLVELLDQPDYNHMEGALSALEKICEDSSRELEDVVQGIRPLTIIIPKILTFFDSPHEKLRILALTSINHLLSALSSTLDEYLQPYLAALFQRAHDDKIEVRKHVCHGLVMLIENHPEKLFPEMSNVVEYMLQSTQDADEALSLEACEFWLSFAEQDELREHFWPHLPRVIPVLLKGMVYNEMDIIAAGGEEDDANVPDQDQSIKPRHHRSKVHDHGHVDSAEDSSAQKAAASNQADDDDDDDDDTDYGSEDEYYAEWNLRKCSAAALDVISSVFGNEILNIILPLLKEKLFHSDWLHRECGILALGAIAEGTISGMDPHLPDIVPYLVQCLNDPKPLIRSISCWTLGRYCQWFVRPANPENKRFFAPVLEGLLRTILDNNKRVQESGCSAFATLEDEAGTELVPYLQPILRNLALAFEKYQTKNLYILYDAVGTLADAVGEALNSPEYIELVMAPLIQKWQVTTDDDSGLFALLECLCSVSCALGTSFMRFAEPIFNRCVHLIHKALMQEQALLQNPELDVPDKDLVAVALDLLSGLSEALGSQLLSLLSASNPPLLQLLAACINDQASDVRQSAFGLIGDLSIHCFEYLRPHMTQIYPQLLNQIQPNPQFPSVCNNATWACGEIALKWGAEVQPFIKPSVERLIPIINNVQSPRTLAENSGITIGRLGLICPLELAPHLEIFSESWCRVLRNIKENSEKESAFIGFCSIVKANPNGLSNSFIFFCDSVASWRQPSVQLKETFAGILNGYKTMLGDNWASYYGGFPAPLKQRLHEAYQL